MPERDPWRVTVRVLLVLAALAMAVLTASGAWLWFEYHPDGSQWVRDVHQVATVVLGVLAFAAFVIAVLRRVRSGIAGIVAAVGVVLAVSATVVTGRLLPWDFLGLKVVSSGDVAGVRAALADGVFVVGIDGHTVSPSTYEFWAYAHLGLALLVAVTFGLWWWRQSTTATTA